MILRARKFSVEQNFDRVDDSDPRGHCNKDTEGVKLEIHKTKVVQHVSRITHMNLLARIGRPGKLADFGSGATQMHF